MLTLKNQKALNDSEDMKLALDGLRAVFQADGDIQPKHRKALDALAWFCKIGHYDYGKNDTEIFRTLGRIEVYNYIIFCLEYSAEERRKLEATIKELEDVRDGRGSSTDSDID